MPLHPHPLPLILAVLTFCACAPAVDAPRVQSDRGVARSAAPGQPTCYPTTAAENATGVSATNAARRGAGLAPVTANTKLAQAAADHACDMAHAGRMGHSVGKSTGPAQRVKARGYRPSITAENIAAGPFSLGQILQIWSKSPGHVDNIMIAQARHFGIGHAIGADGKTVYWSAVYAAPR